jgi:hypothetical protein
MFRVLLSHPQEAMYKRYLVYFVRIMSVGSATIAVKLQSWHRAAPPEDEKVILEKCRGP